MTERSFRWNRHGDALAAAVRPASAAPKRPRGLTGVARTMWDAVAKSLGRVLDARDAAALEHVCQLAAELDRCRVALAALAPGTADHARLSRTLVALTREFTALAGRFGLTPSDRCRLPPAPAAVAAESDDDSYFFGPSRVPQRVPVRPRTALDRSGRPADLDDPD